MALTLEDRREIHTLYAKYNFALDLGNAEDWADCFTPEGSLQVRGETTTGREALVAFARRSQARPVRVRHWNSNIMIEESAAGPGKASSKAYIFAMRLSGTPRPIDFTGIYEDQLVKTPMGWKFVSRKAPEDKFG
jgi:hypothetical protein